MLSRGDLTDDEWAVLEPLLPKTSYETPSEAQRAIDAMDVDDRLDDPDFVARYHQAVEDYREQLALERRKKLRVA